MLYRITLDLAFTSLDPANDIWEEAIRHADEAITINPGQEDEEAPYILLSECHHDESPTSPCPVIHQYPPL